MEKSFVKSKTIWGAVISAVSFVVMGIAGRHNPETLATATTGFLSSLLAVYGRIKARHTLVVKEK
jgi:hypothetical protein